MLSGNCPIFQKGRTRATGADDLGGARRPGQLLGHFRHLQPAQFRRFDLGAVACDALGQFRETPGIAGEQVGVVQRLLVGRDRRFEPLDLAGQPVEVALILVGEFDPPRRRGGGRPKA